MTIRTTLGAVTGTIRKLVGLENYPQVRDISYAQAGFNGAGLAKRGVALMIRMGQNDWIDSRFWEHYNNAIRNKVMFGVFWFFQPDAPFEPQLAAFLAVYNSLPWKPPVICLDVENISFWTTYDENGMQIADADDRPMEILININPPSPAIHTQRLLGWLRGVEKATGHIPGIYTRQNYWDAWTIAGSGFNHFWLWVASWTNYSTNIFMPRDWSKWTLWQSEGGTGRDIDIPGPVDQDSFNGNQEQEVAFFGGTDMPTTPFEPFTVEVTSAWLTVTSGPGNTYPPVKWIPIGTQVLILEQSGTWGRYEVGWISLAYTKIVETTPPPEPPTIQEQLDDLNRARNRIGGEMSRINNICTGVR